MAIRGSPSATADAQRDACTLSEGCRCIRHRMSVRNTDRRGRRYALCRERTGHRSVCAMTGHQGPTMPVPCQFDGLRFPSITEGFVSRERGEWADIDVDLEQERGATRGCPESISATAAPA